MQRSWSGMVCAAAALTAVLAFTPGALAQSVVDGRLAEFTPSADHNAVDQGTGAAIVQRYVLDVFPAGGSTRVSTADLGKPAPGTDGMIRIDFVARLTTALTPGVVYEAVLSAIGPGGTGAGARSNTFAFSAPCAPTIAPTAQSVPAAGGGGNATVSVAAGCAWSAVSNVSWITITGGASGSGPGTVTFVTTANTSTASRSGTLTVAGVTFTVTQAGVACAPAISPTSASVGAATSSGSVGVTAATGCAWTASSHAGWITLTGSTSGSGNGSVGYSVAANSGTASRSGTLTVAGVTFTVTQAGAACAAAISPTSASVGAATSSGSVGVTAATGCAWTASSNAGWITLTGSTSGSGNGSVGYSVAANSGAASRSGTLTVAGVTFTVTQAGVACAPAISPTSASVGAATSSGSVGVTAATGCAWTASSHAGWITLTGSTSGSGNGSVGYSVAANSGAASRSGTLTVAGVTFTVTQAGVACAPAISPTSADAVAAGQAGSVTVAAADGCAWAATSNVPWISITAGSAGSGAGAVSYSVAANGGVAVRTGTLTIASNTFTITQAAGSACSYSLTPSSAEVGSARTTYSVNVTAPAGCGWTAASGASWITILAGASVTGSGTVSYRVAANHALASRTGTMTIAGSTFTVTQAGEPCTPTIAPTSAGALPTAGSGTVSVTAPDGCAWSAAANASWLAVTAGANGNGNGSVAYSVAANSGAARSGTITIAGHTFTVTQGGVPCSYAIAPASAALPASGGGGTVAVTAPTGCTWSATSNASWVAITGGASGSGSGSVAFTAASNTSTASRSATLTIGGRAFTVTQPAGNCTFTVTPLTISAPTAATSGRITVTTQNGCAWSSSSSASWLTVYGSGTGNGHVAYGIQANTGMSARSGVVHVGGVAVTVQQAGPTVPLTAPANLRIVR